MSIIGLVIRIAKYVGKQTLSLNSSSTLVIIFMLERVHQTYNPQGTHTAVDHIDMIK